MNELSSELSDELSEELSKELSEGFSIANCRLRARPLPNVEVTLVTSAQSADSAFLLVRCPLGQAGEAGVHVEELRAEEETGQRAHRKERAERNRLAALVPAGRAGNEPDDYAEYHRGSECHDQSLQADKSANHRRVGQVAKAHPLFLVNTKAAEHARQHVPPQEYGEEYEPGADRGAGKRARDWRLTVDD